MRCLVTGSRGLLGSELVERLRGKGEEVQGWDLPGHDVTDVDRTINGIHKVGPDVIFHLAAWTDVDGCEKDQGKAMSVNFQGTWAVALGAEELGCRLVYMSTDYVFDGRKKRPYRENDKPGPLSVHGRSKLMGEQAVARTCKRHFIVRSSWLYGRGGRNFVDTIRKKAEEQDRIEVVEDQVGSPTWAADLCPPLHELAESDKFGIYHITNSGQASWFEFAREVVNLARADCEVVPIPTERAGRPAPRPAFSVLENRNFKRKFGHVLRPWQDAVRAYLG
jgi:dTDP-4-dehydrorhamnose reductase